MSIDGRQLIERHVTFHKSTLFEHTDGRMVDKWMFNTTLDGTDYASDEISRMVGRDVVGPRTNHFRESHEHLDA